MKARTNVQILKGSDGLPAFAVIPYHEYVSLTGKKSPTIPNEVVGKVIKLDMTPIRAWREYLGLTQSEVAERLGISQAAYTKQENSLRLRKASKEKIAVALGIEIEQLDV
ncbi:helix-turn-helix transcriptional regulator [Oxalobacter vibrioformis]|uniref:Helix-turn-helix transcriptional regulator n=1 Tax=Oxalobacter vibrioformis TaxID=933080 RepID=A0A9E9LV36_9BURK|nr:helix-turn-helix transcriptional regulator [Oxalobacter vibrioformis]WAW09272.1 helix-turn-helix transcriptional regulator [Oxalobacter vibrioformis]